MFFSWEDFFGIFLPMLVKKLLKFAAVFWGSDIVLSTTEIDDGELFYCFFFNLQFD